MKFEIKDLNLKYPLIVAPMGGLMTPQLVSAPSNCKALGSIGAAYMSPQAIIDFTTQVRSLTKNPFAINLFIPHPIPTVTPEKIQSAISATASFRQELKIAEPKVVAPFQENFDEQFETVLRLKPAVLSYVFGNLTAEQTKAAKAANIILIAAATTFEEAQAVESAQADAVVLQGIEGGGHRAIFDPNADDAEVPAFELLKQCYKTINLPLIAAGGLMNKQDIQQALKLGASAVQLGTAFLACKEAGTSPAYKEKLLQSAKRKTKTTRAFSGRLARGIENRFMLEMEKSPDKILPFPIQNKFTRDLRNASAAQNTPDFLSLWAGSGEGELWQGSACDLIQKLFSED